MAGSTRRVAQPDTWELRVFIGRDSLGKSSIAKFAS
ncbi:hypothetical protein FEAC_25040 [Ferrimicrobium acidiphilum DSM 19497]|uniref:Uncharacterized protein n=1 Tax=Ferrimicrobium acidiphilum DSM 19497 TaxID=1121877 RepID=A0A0D8FR35_9ACTN|nr:hypothetical protein FEAC_25040 [Ferrimicrobium acidiphilum DSM 19497]